MIGKTVGNYEIKGKLGEGGMGVVYLAEHPLIGKRVAIKVLREDMATRPDIVSRFFHEAKAANEIGHPNIVDMIDFGQIRSDDGRSLSYMVMELLEGESLNARLKRGPLSTDEARRIISECCSALSASHAKGIIHRDLKPDNIFLCRHAGHELVKLLDFGIAKLTGHSAVDYKTRTGSILGTPQYMSPEQCDGAMKVDLRSDIYSLGVVLYETVTGRVPFPSDGFGGIVVGHLMRPPEPPSSINPNVPKDLESVVLRALEKAPGDRFQNMDEFAAALADPAAHKRVYDAQLANRAPAATTAASSHAVRAGSTLALPSGSVQAALGTAATVSAAHEPPTPTTLSGAASEIITPEPQPWKPRVAIAGVAGVIIAVAIILVVRRPSKVEEPSPSKPVVTAPAEVEVAVRSDPEGAHIIREGKDVGVTPARLRFARSALPMTIVLRHDGFEDQSRLISTGDADLFVQMVPLASPTKPDAAAVVTTQPERTTHPERKHPKTLTTTPHQSKKAKDTDLNILEPKF